MPLMTCKGVFERSEWLVERPIDLLFYLPSIKLRALGDMSLTAKKCLQYQFRAVRKKHYHEVKVPSVSTTHFWDTIASAAQLSIEANLDTEANGIS